MWYQIVEIQEISGPECKIYTVILKGQQNSLFDQFLEDNSESYKEEVNEMAEKLYRMGNQVGARSQYFKFNEGKPGDLMCALFDEPGKILRLFCIRIGMNILIIGGGAVKPNHIKSWQEDPKLTTAGNLMIKLAEDIGERLEKRDDLWLSKDQQGIQGQLKNYQDEEDE